ncbi:lipocalin-like domain-containing protein [Reyranella sp.]|uniref:lipocalin-like domain-containing protein n=1 Tax=Reyranella sp. TaxID=1929291 RepID=UPI003D0D4323
MTGGDGIVQPVGAWELVSLVSERPDGSTFETFGPHPSGRLIYGESGQVIAMIVGERRNEAAGKPTPPEFLRQFTAYFGTYRVDGEKGEIVHNVATSLNGPQASGELRRQYRMENGRLFLSFSRMREGVEVVTRVEWKRISTR